MDKEQLIDLVIEEMLKDIKKAKDYTVISILKLVNLVIRLAYLL